MKKKTAKKRASKKSAVKPKPQKSSKQETELLKVYDSYWDSYTKGDIKSISKLLIEDYNQVGSAETEFFTNKKQAVKFLHDTIDQVAGKAELRNRIKRVDYLDDFVLISEQCDLYALSDGKWMFYSKFRASTMMQQRKGKWKIIHQHSSVPDLKALEGENLAIDKIAAENQQLREAVKRRTVELENKYRELEIEAALERVRVRAMAMKKSEELAEIVSVLFKQLLGLGLTLDQLRTCGIATFHPSELKGDIWITDIKGEKISNSFSAPFNEAPAYKAIYRKWKKGEDFFELNLKGKDFLEHLKFVKKYSSVPDINLQEIKKKYKEIFFHVLYFSQGYLFIITYEELTEHHELFKRFGAIFQQTYTRFLDLQKAEAQAREAQIELALERVRARTMAMQHSDELSEVAAVLFKQISSLTKTPNRFNIGIVNEKEKAFDIWITDQQGQRVNQRFVGRAAKSPVIASIIKAWKGKKKQHIQDLHGKSLKSWIKYMHGELGIPFDMKRVKDHRYLNSILFSHGFIGTTTNEPIHIEVLELLERFAKVFEQTYTRFLDLQKAEAQAREAQIELALERVRARTMAMQKSEELKEVIQLVYDQFVQLDIHIEHTGFILDYKTRDDMHIWLADKNEVPAEITIPYFDSSHWNSFIQARRKGTDFFANHLSFKEKNKFYRSLFKLIPNVAKKTREYYLGCPGLAISTVLLDNVGLYIENFSGIPYTSEENGTLMRFGKVFQQTYTRFLDLQKAEAQARDAQIEAALERVRSRSLAMHHSHEIKEVVLMVMEKMNELEIEMDGGVSLATFRDGSRDLIHWYVNPEHVDGAIEMHLPYFKNKLFTDFEKARKQGMELLPVVYSFEDKNEYFNYAFKHSEFKIIPKALKQWILEQPCFGYSVAIQKHSAIFFNDYSGKFFSEQENQVLIRFAKVFDQAYIRFLDLQKAEAQAREAQIETALERVRASTMAMHVSQDVSEATGVLFKEIEILGLYSIACGLNIIGGKDELQTWTTKRLGKDIFQVSGTLKLEHPSVVKLYQDWKSKKETSIYKLKGNEVKKFFDGVYKQSDYKTPKFKKLPKVLILNNFIIPEGSLWVFTEEEIDKNLASVLKRFANVFSLTYRRYKDLQNAEAQAREAQIEAALERVRAGSMAMHKSGELNRVITIVLTELRKLDISLEGAQIYLIDSESEKFSFWIQDAINSFAEKVYFPVYDHPLIQQFLKAGTGKEQLITDKFDKSLKNEFFKRAFKDSDLKALPTKRKRHILDSPGYIRSMAVTRHAILAIDNFGQTPFTEEENRIIRRVASVFEQAYTRFLDLKKAEAQAREAEIELALERVRARTMAMQRSEELPEAANTLFLQVQSLGIPAWSCGYNILSADKKSSTCIMSSEGELQTPFTLPLTKHKSLKPWHNAILKGDEFFVYQQGGKELAEHYRYMKSLPELQSVFKQFDDAGLSLPTFQVNHLAKFKEGFLLFITYQPVPDAHEIFKRFTKVFEQTYTRFLDLQKAEAQAREAEIETALERIRARTMAMRRGDELSDTSLLLFEQITNLGIKLRSCGFLIMDEETKSMADWSANVDESDKGTLVIGRLAYDQHPLIAQVVDCWRRGGPYFIGEMHGEELQRYYEAVTYNENLSAEIKEKVLPKITSEYTNSFYFKYGMMYILTPIPLQQSEIQMMLRFAAALKLTYTRFLDLQNAEAQARESQIQLALERVRARTMAMHQSAELRDAGNMVFQQMKELGIKAESSWLWFIDAEKNDLEIWTTHENKLADPVKVKAGDLWTFKKEIDAWKKEDPILKLAIPKKEAQQSIKNIFGVKIKSNRQATHFHLLQTRHNHGFLGLGTWHEATAEEQQICSRFAKVFEQTYRRFLDLQKAEAQARESQIEAGLERVRSKTMAMHNSQDVGNTVASLFDELVELGLEKSARCGIGILDESDTMELWTASTNDKGELILSIGHLNMTLHPLMKGVKKTWSSKKQSFTYELQGEDLINYFNALNDYPDYSFFVDVKTLPDKIIHNSFYFTDGLIYCFTQNSISEDLAKVVKRFAGVFGQTYKRFLDLQKAEAQAREAQIEAALERVRSRSMAMHKSEELLDVITVVSEQLTNLDFKFNHVSFANNDLDQDYKFWVSARGLPNPMRFNVPYLDISIMRQLRESQLRGDNFHTDVLSKEENQQWHKHLLNHGGNMVFPDDVNEYAMSRGMARSIAINPNIMLILANYASVPYSEDENKIIARFGQVFEQSYTRFLDLQKAEAQGREAQVELSLERIRAQALAMRVSTDLLDIVVTMRTEFVALGHEAHYFWHMRWLPEKYEKAMTSGDGARIGMVMELPRHMHGDIKLLADWEKSVEDTVVYVMDADAAINYVDKMVSLGDFKQVDPNAPSHDDIRHIGGLTFIMARTTHGEIGYSLPGMKPDVPASDLATLVRFAGAFDLAYKRFEDLVKTEAREKEAIRQASLDRLRAEIASMRTTNDLERITPLIWKELTILNIPFIRCGVFIMDELQQQIHTFLSTPDGRAIAAFHLPYDVPGRTGEILAHWIKKQVYINHWDETAFSELGDLLVQQEALPSKEAYLSTVPKDGIYLHCLPFMQGMLYVGNSIKLNDDDIHLIQSVADAFSTAYARYEDFNKLEFAKQQVDNALVELKQAQTQLVQSEKMASLGELTAGIAHEIQNPLNFVNNFSEVSNELLVEMKEEIEKGNVAEVMAITEDVIANLEKILHHGRRADGIVKGMLQHSRSSSGVKEPTDINMLADEYLRLAYHGLRAKDKSFNAKFETHFDEHIGKVKVIPQDIGRVVLNLITNAFYAVTLRLSKGDSGYEPTVTVSTKREGDKVLISVKDNGNGIPDSIKEKIFQPFFTTKPTGQGTGLGLSLSYDIVKAHGGELKVESIEGEGSTFYILLPF